MEGHIFREILYCSVEDDNKYLQEMQNPFRKHLVKWDAKLHLNETKLFFLIILNIYMETSLHESLKMHYYLKVD